MEGGTSREDGANKPNVFSMKSSIINTVILQQQKRIAELEAELKQSLKQVQKSKLSARRWQSSRSTASADSRMGVSKNSSELSKKRPSCAGKLSDTSGQTRYWTAEEHSRFLTACKKYGARNYTAVSMYVGTRTPKQVSLTSCNDTRVWFA